jgi:hypothetical protein
MPINGAIKTLMAAGAASSAGGDFLVQFTGSPVTRIEGGPIALFTQPYNEYGVFVDSNGDLLVDSNGDALAYAL